MFQQLQGGAMKSSSRSEMYFMVLPTGIEPVFPASEASGLSVNLREQKKVLRVFRSLHGNFL